MSRCFFRQFASDGLRDCDGPVQLHHVVKQQTLRRELDPGRRHLLEDLELREAKGRTSRALKDSRNLLPACKRHHDAWHRNRERFSLTRAELPDGLEAFAAEYGVEWDLFLQFGPRESVSSSLRGSEA